MDLHDFYDSHISNKADTSISATMVDRVKTSSPGLLQVGEDVIVAKFVEKPGEKDDISSLRMVPQIKEKKLWRRAVIPRFYGRLSV